MNCPIIGAKRVLIIVLCAILLVGAGNRYALAYDAASSIKVIVNGNELKTDLPPFLMNNRIMVPFRDVFEALGQMVEWDPYMRMINSTKGNKKISLQLNSYTAWIDYKEVKLDVSPCMVGDKTVVPLRFVAESLGEPVKWDPETRTVTIGAPKKSEPLTPVVKGNIGCGYTSGSQLRTDTALEYQAGKKTVFKAGNVINFNIEGYVSSGVLKNDTSLNYSRETAGIVVLKADSTVVFNEQGYFKKGIILNETSLPYISKDKVSVSLVPFPDRNMVLVKKDTEVEFYDNGYLKTAVIDKDATVLYDEYGSVLLKSDSAVTFGETGYLLSGVLRGSSVLPYAVDKDGVFDELTTINFSSAHFVSSGILAEKTQLAYAENQYVYTKAHTRIEFYETGMVKSGTIAQDITLKLPNGSYQSFKENALVNFDDDGLVKI